MTDDSPSAGRSQNRSRARKRRCPGPVRWDVAGVVAESAFVTAVSERGRESLRTLAGPNWAHKVHLVPCGVTRPFLRARPLPQGPRRLCVVARLTERKGVGLLLDALASAVGAGADLRLEVVGDGELMGVLAARAAAPDLAGRVSFRGALDERGVRRAVAGSHGLVLPSLREGLPVVLMEAMGLGRPVIASRVDGVPELVEDGMHGWLVAPGDRAGLAAALGAFARCEAGELEAMGRRGNARVRERHDARRAARVLDGLVRGAVAADGRERVISDAEGVGRFVRL